MQGNDTMNDSYSRPQGYDNSSFIRQPQATRRTDNSSWLMNRSMFPANNNYNN